jgi:hypothetical protein
MNFKKVFTKTYWQDNFYTIIGKVYIANTTSRIIHSVENAGKVCKLDKIPEGGHRHISRKESLRLIREEGYHFCRWCFETFYVTNTKK